METLYLLVPLSLMLVLAVVVVLWWAVQDGQFEDMEGADYAILMDDDTPSGVDETPPSARSSREA
ncbi:MULTISPECIES: cbb3-type cytochrome oxidase assembly protein CcoS [Pigmentiphaga]|uniref:Cbb3-type cytochrome oxidase maturation protein n=1 Tax=Pigmentiphaga kullae TaxID=151784 RepID=A0A4Q7NIG1_9BURK|nr:MULTISPECIES: cbb3-type cytochrome oxidase assembly protein CcoS [Pigmentiphaga]RZS84804.1 cbb3-type cytochrome oxidase maturation protein [Pigmentiphaga kullae]